MCSTQASEFSSESTTQVPVQTLQGSGIEPGQNVLEVGCGTGFFTIPAAEMLGEQGKLVAMDVTSGFLDQLSRKVEQSDLHNVQIIKCDALNTGLDSSVMDLVLLFGVLPYPFLPLSKLLPEMFRVLKPEGTIAVWLFPPLVHFFFFFSINHSGFFVFSNKKNAVYNYKKIKSG